MVKVELTDFEKEMRKQMIKKTYDEIWIKEQLEDGITLEMIKKIRSYLDCFISKTYPYYITKYYNGFLGIGILKNPTNHIIKRINVIWFYSIGFNKKGTDVQVVFDHKMALEEAEVIYATFGIGIDMYKIEKESKAIEDYKNEYDIKGKVNTNTNKFRKYFEKWKKSQYIHKIIPIINTGGEKKNE